MTRSSELVDDFGKRIVNARKDRQWSQQQLAKRMARNRQYCQSRRIGKRPTDSVITKFERVLSIKLMEERTAEESRHVNAGHHGA